MITDWHSGMQGVADTIINAFGQTVIVTPCVRKPNFDAVPIPERAVTLQAEFLWRSKIIFKQNSGTSFQTQEPMIETRVPVFRFAIHDLPFFLNAGDQIELCSNGDVFRVKYTETDGVALYEAHCDQLGLKDF